jgi:hypothetical protein
MFAINQPGRDERGSTLLEFAIGATVFFITIFAIMEFGRGLWTHNALSDAARRGARYAILQPASNPPGATVNGTNVGPSVTAIRNVAVYGDPNGGTQPLIPNLAPENVQVQYAGYGLGGGTVSVTITGYELQLMIPIVGQKIQMPNYQTTLTGESAGLLPPTL